MTEATGVKKSTSWVDRWKARRALAAVDKERQRREKALAARGEWGYIPPGCVLMSKSRFAIIEACLWVILISQSVILVGQWRSFWSHYFVSQPQTIGAAAMTPPTAATSPTK